MNSRNSRPSPSSSAPTAPCRRPPSLEVTPDEFDYFVKQAHRMRAETVAVFVSGWLAGLARLFARTKSLLRPRGPVRMADKRTQSRAA